MPILPCRRPCISDLALFQLCRIHLCADFCSLQGAHWGQFIKMGQTRIRASPFKQQCPQSCCLTGSPFPPVRGEPPFLPALLTSLLAACTVVYRHHHFQGSPRALSGCFWVLNCITLSALPECWAGKLPALKSFQLLFIFLPLPRCLHRFPYPQRVILCLLRSFSSPLPSKFLFFFKLMYYTPIDNIKFKKITASIVSYEWPFKDSSIIFFCQFQGIVYICTQQNDRPIIQER